MSYTIRQKNFELQNNFLALTIDWFEELADERDVVFPYHRNVLNLIYESDPAVPSFAEDVATGTRYLQEAGDIVLIPVGLNTRHRLRRETRFLTLHFALEFISGVDLFSRSDRICRFHDPALVEKFRRLQSADDPVRAMLELRTMVMEICLRCYPETPGISAPTAEKYCRILAGVASRIDALTSVGDLARSAGRCRETFARHFRRDLGVTPTAWLHRALVGRIAGMLNDPELTLKEIAERLRFSSEFYLSRFFRKQTGVPPRDYRKLFTSLPPPKDNPGVPGGVRPSHG